MIDAPAIQKPVHELVHEALIRLTGMLDRNREEGGLSTDDLAELRRMDPAPDSPLPSAIWRLMTNETVGNALRHLAPNDREAGERAFALLIQVMATVPGRPGGTIGEVLAETGYAEQRFVRLLRARGRAEVAQEAGLAARWCAARGASPRFIGRNGFGAFILDAALEHPGSAARCAHAIARDYFGATSMEP